MTFSDGYGHRTSIPIATFIIYNELGEAVGFSIDDGTDIKVYYYMKDVTGQIDSVVDIETNTIIYSCTYDAWGSILDEYCTDALVAYGNPLRYKDYNYDIDSDLYYLQSRYYDSYMGRFLNADDPAITDTGTNTGLSTNMYLYCENDPINNIDILGTASYRIGSYSSTWVTKFLLKYVSYAYDYSKTIWEFKKIPGVKITLQSTASYSTGGLGLFKINNKGGLSVSFGGISVSAMSGSRTVSSTFTYKGSSVGAFIGISGKYLNLGYYAYSTVSNRYSKISIGFKLTISIHIAYVATFVAATYAVKCFCPALAPATAVVKALYRTPAGIYSQALVLSGGIYAVVR